MSKPTQSIFPIENGKLTTNLDCNNLQLLNLDESNLSGGSGGGGTTRVITGTISSTGLGTGTITDSANGFFPTDVGATIGITGLGFTAVSSEITAFVDSGTITIADTTAATPVDLSASISHSSTGNDTGTTTAMLKGDGNHGFADAVAGTDYATPASVALKEDS